MKSIKSAGVIGAGVIGSGWIARLLLNGIDVYVYDPSAEAPINFNKEPLRLISIPHPTPQYGQVVLKLI